MLQMCLDEVVPLQPHGKNTISTVSLPLRLLKHTDDLRVSLMNMHSPDMIRERQRSRLNCPII